MFFVFSIHVSAKDTISFQSETLTTLDPDEYRHVIPFKNHLLIISSNAVLALPVAPTTQVPDAVADAVRWLQQWQLSAASDHVRVQFSTINDELVAGIISQSQLKISKPRFSDATFEDITKPLVLQQNVESLAFAQQHDGESEKLFVFLFYEQTLLDIWKWAPLQASWQRVQHSLTSAVPQGDIQTALALQKTFIVTLSKSGSLYLFNTVTNEWTENAKLAHSGLDIFSLVKHQGQVSQFGVYRLQSAPGELSYVSATFKHRAPTFGFVNMLVLIAYVLIVLLIGLLFSYKNRNAKDFFLAGKSIPWWAAACSIYATLLSSLTYLALPAMVYRTNWVLLVGIWTLVIVAPISIYSVMPFFRRLSIVSAYEYLSYRFSNSTRVLASIMFSLFHIGRMGVVMALTALALSAVTPMSAAVCVLIMGGLCLIYCTFGGIAAVIWTDTLQTLVLLLGAILCLVFIMLNIDGGFDTFIRIGFDNNKFTLADTRFSLSGITELTLWVIVVGGIGQNLSSYIADQTVVQRYLVTPNEKSAARAIWANVFVGLPCAILFFLIGTGLYVFYKTQPDKLDPTMQLDQLLPGFISTELPIGIAGLIIAGVFSAAQSTISTSINSVTTTIIVDVIKPTNIINNEVYSIKLTRVMAFLVGCIGIGAGLLFIDPNIRSLMEEYFKIIGMFMGALGGLFILGVTSTRATSFGASVGLFCGIAIMLSAWKFGWANGYIYASLGIVTCVIVGYLTSIIAAVVCVYFRRV